MKTGMSVERTAVLAMRTGFNGLGVLLAHGSGKHKDFGRLHWQEQ